MYLISLPLAKDHTNRIFTTGINKLQRSLLTVRQARQRTRRTAVPRRSTARMWTEPYIGRDPGAGGEPRRGLYVPPFCYRNSISPSEHLFHDTEHGYAVQA